MAHSCPISPLYWIHPRDSDSSFPDVSEALDDPNGLLAVGGNLGTRRLLNAYRSAIFPWYSDDQPILWWSPDPREVLLPEGLHVPRSLRRQIRRGTFRVTFDTAFDAVVAGCAEPRRDGHGTWITRGMRRAYGRLFERRIAHSAEAWLGDELAGGLYGVSIGRVFSGESMFARHDDASKVAFVYLIRQLQRWGYALVDCQLRTEHLRRFGSVSMPRDEYRALLERHRDEPGKTGPWTLDPTLDAVLRASGQ